MAVLGLVKLTLGLIEVLQRDHGAGVGVDAKRHGFLHSILVGDARSARPWAKWPAREFCNRRARIGRL